MSKNRRQKCKFWLVFLAVFIDDKGSLKVYDLRNGNFIQEYSKVSEQQILMPLFLYTD